MCLGRVVTDILLSSSGCNRGMVRCEALDLLLLLVDNGSEMLDVLVNGFLVGLVYEGCQEYDGSGNERETPEWDNLDQKVREESTNECLDSISV